MLRVVCYKPRYWQHHPQLEHLMQRSTLGILLCMGSMLSFAVQDIITKIILTGGIPLGQLLTVRYASFTLFAVIAAGGAAGTLQALRSSAPKMQIGRASLSMLE